MGISFISFTCVPRSRIILKATKQLSKVVAPFYTLTSNEWNFQLTCILINIWYCQSLIVAVLEGVWCYLIAGSLLSWEKFLACLKTSSNTNFWVLCFTLKDGAQKVWLSPDPDLTLSLAHWYRQLEIGQTKHHIPQKHSARSLGSWWTFQVATLLRCESSFS